MTTIILLVILFIALPFALRQRIIRRVVFLVSALALGLLSIHLLIVAGIFTYAKFHPVISSAPH